MLSVKEISKTYVPKKGVPVKALDNVSLSFADKGLVFILGKSGSGKSTLLNIMGGLDIADSGEFIIKGRSSKDFKAADFNAYRNTCVGFIFQEYNILEEFSVGENIAMALEFQGRAADSETMDNILKEVDLEGYAKRKPNELSGGQMQRVAIARALIKNPEIIMADEPTGALDSETGRQVLETLKKLSEDKLVIVVSHDREFAQQYGDRVIELADGKVIHDSEESANDNASCNVESYNADSYSVGSDNSESSSVENYNADSDNAEGGRDESKDKSAFIRSRLPYKRALKMGAVSIKSKPLRLVITMLLCFFSFTLMGVIDTGMAYSSKKVAVEGLANVGYDSIAAIGGQWKTDIREPDIMDYYSGMSQDELDELKESTGMDFRGVALLSVDNVRTHDLFFADEGALSGDNYSPYYTGALSGFLPAEDALIDSIGEIIAGRLPRSDKEIVITKYLYEQYVVAGYRYQDTSSDELIYVAPSQLKSPQEFLDINPLIEYNQYVSGKRVRIDTWTVVGILDTGADKNGMFDNLKPSKDNWARDTLYDYEIRHNCSQYFQYGYHSLGYVKTEQYEEFTNGQQVYPNGVNPWAKAARGEIFLDKNTRISILGAAKDCDLDKVNEVIWLDGKQRTKLEDNEIVIGMNAANKIIVSDIYSEMKYYSHNKIYLNGEVSFERCRIGDLTRAGAEIAICQYAERVPFDKLQPFIDYIKEDRQRLRVSFYYSNEHFRTDKWDIDNMDETQWRLAYAGYLNETNYSVNDNSYTGGYYSNITGLPTGEQIALTDGYKIYIQAKLENFTYNTEFEEAYVDFLQASSYQNSAYRSNASALKIVGIYVMNYDDALYLDRADPYVFSNKIYEMAPEKEFRYAFAVAKMPTERKDIQMLIDFHYNNNGRQAKLINGVVELTSSITVSVYGWIDNILQYAMIVLVIMSVAQLSNYIAASIYERRKDIGILRALGAKSGDICAIFCTESVIVALINCALSIIATPLICVGVNSVLPKLFHINVKLFYFGIRQAAVIFGMGIGTALLASIIPIIRICRKQPIDSIRGK
ncbi:MAG: ATP-binding cassette domain-containing protein [Clostridia bacterium]|nr:ATP-binding cassette domain-containing protein [Clostridia bacterium]